MGSRAAGQASQLQYAASQKAIQEFKDALARTNPQIQTAADQARADAIAAANTAGTGLTGAASTAGANLTGAANTLFSPYAQAGQGAIQNLAQMMAPGGQLTQQFGLEQMQQNDPGYQFRIDMANRALQSSAAARGGALGGGALRSLQTQSQNLASSEMENAFGRWNTQQGNLFNRLNTLAGTGMQAGQQILGANQQAGQWGVGAAGQAGDWLTQGTQYGGTAQQNAASNIAQNTMGAYKSIADLLTGGASAQAAGTMGAANAWSGALGGIGNAAGQVGNYYQQQNLLNWLRQNPGVFGNPAIGRV
jgi:hypothetical protein